MTRYEKLKQAVEDFCKRVPATDDQWRSATEFRWNIVQYQNAVQKLKQELKEIENE